MRTHAGIEFETSVTVQPKLQVMKYVARQGASCSLQLLSPATKKGRIQVKATLVYWHADISKRLQDALSYLQP